MEDTFLNPKNHSDSGKEPKAAQTPHELYNYHMLHPDEPITDEDIRNLKIDTGAVARDHQLTEKEAIASTVNSEESNNRADIEEDVTDSEKRKASSYDILGG